MTDIAGLLERMRVATGPSSELNAELHELCGLPFEMEYWTESDTIPVRNLSKVPRYTASVDAALALVERKLPGWMVVNLCEWDADVLRKRGPWNCALKLIGTQDDLRAPKGQCHHAPTPALALLAALLSALSSGDVS